MKLFTGNTIPEVWTNACTYLRDETDNGEAFDIFLGIENPTVINIADKAVIDAVNNLLKANAGYPLETVAETIFPLAFYSRGGAKAVFNEYPERIKMIRKGRGDNRWGCYALRLIDERVDRKGRNYRPLEALIIKINKWKTIRAAYEVSMGPFEDDIAIYDADADRLQGYGGPCLSHLSFKVDNGTLRLNATFRSHYYIQRALGNAIGLGRLQIFIAQQCGLEVGPLAINSTFAKLDKGSDNQKSSHWTAAQISSLIDVCADKFSAAS